MIGTLNTITTSPHRIDIALVKIMAKLFPDDNDKALELDAEFESESFVCNA